MLDKLVIVESPSKAKTIQKYLGDGFEVIASEGHIIDLPASKFGINIENDFALEYITLKGKTKKINEIKKLAKQASKVYLATDPDREGEAIAWHLKNVLGIKEKEKCRIAFNEITESAVKKAVKEPSVINDSLVEAQQTRRALDRVVGYKISPLLWKKIKKGLSAGRVQSSTMKMIMDREKQIRDFKPEEYWNLTAILNQKKSTRKIIAKFYGDKKGRIDLKEEKQVAEIVQNIDKKDFIVIDIKKAEKRRNPPMPFITSSLGQEASRKLGYTIKKTMMIAQKLYEAGHITYMRTDSTRISAEAQKMAKEYILKNFGENYYLNRNFKAKESAQDAHEAIRPTKLKELTSAKLSKEELKLFSLIYNRFLASQMTSAVYDTTKITYEVEKYLFHSTGSVIKFDGFMKLYIEGKDEENEEESNLLPEMKIEEVLKQKELIQEQKFTEPPARYTEATLVKTLEEKGIGRPSTYAPTISTILERLYIEKEGKHLVPTSIGEIVNDVMEKNFETIVDDKFTALMETKLDKIALGEEHYLQTMQEFYPSFMANLEKAEKTIEKVKIQDEVSDVICELCGKNMVIKTGRFGKFLACPGFPECKNIKSIVTKIAAKCPKCAGDILVKKTKKKRIFYVCENSPKTCDYISWNKPKQNE